MHRETAEADRRLRMKRLEPAIRIAVILLLTALAVLASTRIVHWSRQGQEARLTALVNPWNSVETVRFTPHLVEVEGVQVDKSIQKPLRALLSACRAAGFDVRLKEGYVSPEEQERRYEQHLQALLAQGYGREEAELLLATDLYRPGYCEQELGLTVAFLPEPGDAGGDSLCAWLGANCRAYGFILRYPESGREVTGTANNILYRYVGQAAAEQIEALGITLEEYQAMFYGESAAIIFED